MAGIVLQDDAGGEQPVGPRQHLAHEAGEAAGLVPPGGRRVEDRPQHGIANRIRGPVLRLEAEVRHAPAENRQDHRAGGDAQEGREFQLGRTHREALGQDEVAAGHRHGETQERQRRGLVPRQHRDEVAQAQQRQRAERRADPHREGDRGGVMTPGRAPGQDEGIGFHAAPGGVRAVPMRPGA
jgi:hypothetical protein